MCIIAVVERHEKPETDREETVRTPPKKMCAHLVDLLQLETLTA
jgi:hypothetical protein